MIKQHLLRCLPDERLHAASSGLARFPRVPQSQWCFGPALCWLLEKLPAFLLALAPLLVSVLLSCPTSVTASLQKAWELRQRAECATLGAHCDWLCWAAGWKSSKCFEMQPINVKQCVKCSGLQLGMTAGESYPRCLFTVCSRNLE